MPESAQREENAASNRSSSNGNSVKDPEKSFPISSAGDTPNSNRAFAEKELDSALQLLVERAQYITGATGTALALPQGDEMVCRASAGLSAPAIGARLQVQSGLTGESIARRQLLRCDNAESDPRVNLETCRALGIASIVVLPLLRRNGEVRGLFELFSDHPYAFEERDLIALERMADLTITALDLAEHRERGERPSAEGEKSVDSLVAVDPEPALSPDDAQVQIAATKLEDTKTGTDIIENAVALPRQPAKPLAVTSPLPPVAQEAVVEAPKVPISEVEVSRSLPETLSTEISEPKMAPVASNPRLPEAMLRVQKCASCGFPVSEGRQLCLDCEKSGAPKNDHDVGKKDSKSTQTSESQAESQAKIVAVVAPPARTESGKEITDGDPNAAPSEPSEQFVPSFLANAVPAKESWLSNHVNLLAIAVVVMGILVAVVVFR
jgi:putative methionine-R-sulfoxide reductase with GAF domain